MKRDMIVLNFQVKEPNNLADRYGNWDTVKIFRALCVSVEKLRVSILLNISVSKTIRFGKRLEMFVLLMEVNWQLLVTRLRKSSSTLTLGELKLRRG